jgi:hypothetical protein
MLRILLSLLLATAAAAYNIQKRCLSSTALNVKSKALPFLEAPPKLDGSAVGDFGFDPMGLSESFTNYNYLRASEIKHGRVAMLATVGFIFQQYVHIVSPESNPLKAVGALGVGPNFQVFSFIAVLEFITWNKTYFGTSPGK